jgi:sterol desaturase/sphingolipid hydroxylase (fatty acid hydroxylase superfamily)
MPVPLAAALSSHLAFLLQPHSQELSSASTLFFPWLVQLLLSWVGFSIYIAWDCSARSRGTLESEKLPSRHPIHVSPLSPEEAGVLPDGRLLLFRGLLPEALCPAVSVFWYSQLFMVPLVLFNQCVVWPLTSLLLVWPLWAQREAPLASWGGLLGSVAALIPLMLISDQLWYWSHRLMHTPWCWANLHRMHHIAPQCAISATYVHPWEYAMFCASMQLPFAAAGFPMWVHAVPMGWGMLTGSGAHSGYGGSFANGEKHGTGHHLYHSANFGLLMIADVMYGEWRAERETERMGLQRASSLSCLLSSSLHRSRLRSLCACSLVSLSHSIGPAPLLALQALTGLLGTLLLGASRLGMRLSPSIRSALAPAQRQPWLQ